MEGELASAISLQIKQDEKSIDELIKDEEIKVVKRVPLDLDDIDMKTNEFTQKTKKKLSALQSPASKFTASSFTTTTPVT